VFGLEPLQGNATCFEITNSNLGKAQFFRIRFDKFDEIIFIDSFLSEINLINCEWRKDNFCIVTSNKRNSLQSTEKQLEEHKQFRENFKQLKHVYEKQGDKINETFFYALEMNSYSSLIKENNPLKDVFWDRIIILLSRWLTDYGRSFLRPFVGILASNLFVLLILIHFFEYHSLSIVKPVNNDPEAFNVALGEYFKLINPLHKMDECLTGLGVLWDLVSRIFSSYFLYGLIRSSRRFLR